MSRGFSLENEQWGRGWGNGVYLSGTEAFAATWGSIIIVCELAAGTRILWHDDYDAKVIRYLRREFGTAITTPEFWKTLPRNKQFTRNELVNLWHYLTSNFYEGKRRFTKGYFERLWKNYSRLHQQLKLHGYDGAGFRAPDWPEMLVFNPSNVIPVSAHRWSRVTNSLGQPVSKWRLQLMQKKANQRLEE